MVLGIVHFLSFDENACNYPEILNAMEMNFEIPSDNPWQLLPSI
jgi:hypothetical protein